MTGKKKGVFAFMLDKQPQLHLSGCPCHLIHLAAEKGASQLPFNIDEILVDIYYYLDKSSKRLSGLGEWQKLYDVEHKTILRHVSTRWLSIGKSLDRVLENWNALKQFFHEEANTIRENARKKTQKEHSKSESASVKMSSKSVTKGQKSKSTNPPSKKPNSKVPTTSGNENKDMKSCAPQLSKAERLETFFKSPTNKLYCLFLKYAMKSFDQVNVKLQNEAPPIHKLQSILTKLMRDLLVRFITPAGMHSVHVTEVSLDDEKLLKPASEVLIGEEARKFISMKTEMHLRDSRIEEFYANARLFYVASCKYIKQKFPLTDTLLSHAEVADIDLQLHKSLSDLQYFQKKYPCLVPVGCSLDTREMEYTTYQSYELPKALLEIDRMDKKWVRLSEVKDATDEMMFSNLSKFMLGILTIPHSNAACERVFSVVRKNKTYQRASLGLLQIKASETEPHNNRYTPEKLRRLKSAYYESLKKYD
ncbi:uncharacterized protein [Haliotis asinina]|uniref:uncharacterized protein n=1 Tax=Haliotis asinina TaxID=109174 RepID=UPI003531FA47